jgi:hypothetical protein
MPWIDLEGAVNVRDLGALPTDDGGQTVAGRLLRADNLQELSPSDVSRLVHDIGLTTVVDLRSSAELASEGPAPLDAIPAVRHVHHPVVPEIGEATDVVAEALLLKAMQDRSRFPSDPTCGHYLGYLEDRPDQVLGAVRSIAHDQGAAPAGRPSWPTTPRQGSAPRPSSAACAGHRRTPAISTACPPTPTGLARRRWRRFWSRSTPATAGSTGG